MDSIEVCFKKNRVAILLLQFFRKVLISNRSCNSLFDYFTWLSLFFVHLIIFFYLWIINLRSKRPGVTYNLQKFLLKIKLNRINNFLLLIFYLLCSQRTLLFRKNGEIVLQDFNYANIQIQSKKFANDLYISIILSQMELRIHPNSAFRPVRIQNGPKQNQMDPESEESAFDGSSSAFKLISFKELQSNFLDSQVAVESPKIDEMIIQKEEQPEKAQISNEKEGKPRKFPYNDTKNIPKNFGKAIIAFVQKNPHIIKTCLKDTEVDYDQFLLQIKKRKRQLHSIKQLRSMWLNNEFEFAQSFRKMSLYFMKRSSMKYIFNSRVVDFGGHLKYRKRIISALSCPSDFYSIKHE